VGENLLEQPNHILAYSGDLGSSGSAYHTFVTMADIFGSDVAVVGAATRANIPKWAKQAVDASGSGALNATAVEKLLRIQHDLLFKHNVTAAELLTVVAPVGGGLLASNYWILMPFSRGSVHLGSADKINGPLIDPRLFLADFDLTAQVATGKLAQKFWLSESMSNFVVGPLIPGSDVLPDNATDAQWEAYTRGSGEYLFPTSWSPRRQDTNGAANRFDIVVNANSHPLGTASMMSRELGGVVDPELRVYGTANLRVVDASVLPMQISGHLTATIYAVAEKASEIIKRTSH
jgi:choline dehydrogenase